MKATKAPLVADESGQDSAEGTTLRGKLARRLGVHAREVFKVVIQ